MNINDLISHTKSDIDMDANNTKKRKKHKKISKTEFYIKLKKYQKSLIYRVIK